MTNPASTVLPPSAPTPKAIRPLRIAAGTKGGVCVYGLQRFPVTLYAEQWEQVLGNAEAIRAFIVANAAILTYKA